jgi:hypothetical protein
MVFASIGILVYVFGIPLGMFYVLFRLRYANKLKHDDSLMVFGFLYTDFEPGFWFWNCVLCARRFILVFVMIVLRDLPQFQVCCFKGPTHHPQKSASSDVSSPDIFQIRFTRHLAHFRIS